MIRAQLCCRSTLSYLTEYTIGEAFRESQGFHTDRTSNRRRDHRHLGRDRDSEVRQHEGEGVSGFDEVGPPEPRDGRRGVFRRLGEVLDEPGYGLRHHEWCGCRAWTADDDYVDGGWLGGDGWSLHDHQAVRDLRRLDDCHLGDQGRRAEVQVRIHS